MAEVKHTPGEWRLDTVPLATAFGAAAGRAYGVSAATPLGQRIPVVVWQGIARPASDEGQANARLIAAAPDLFEALPDLTHVIAWLRNGCEVQHAVTELEIYQRRIDAALSKATAQQEGR